MPYRQSTKVTIWLILIILSLSQSNLCNAGAVGSMTQSLNLTIHGDIITNSIGLYGTGTGTLAIGGIPSGATVSKAILYWSTSGSSSFTSPTLKGQPVGGSVIGTYTAAAHNFTAVVNHYGYRADVTSIVTGNGTYVIAGLPSTTPNNNTSWGASLLVFYESPNLANKTIIINDGLMSSSGALPFPVVTFSGIPASVSAYQYFTVFAGDGREDPDALGARNTYWLNGSTNLLGSFKFMSDMGPYWDEKTFISGQTDWWEDPPYCVPCAPFVNPTTIQFNTNLPYVAILLGFQNNNVQFTFPPNDPLPPALPDPTSAKVLKQKHGGSDSYPSHQSDDGKIQITGVITGGGNIGGRPVQLRIVDPEDPSPYVPRLVPYSTPDNKGGAAKLSPDGVSTGQDLLTVTSDGSGNVQAFLILPADAAGGDNYQVEASLDNFATTVKSGTITVWKRAYEERDAMFRKGSFVKSPNNTGGSDRIQVVDRNQFKSCTQVRIIHAPRLDGTDLFTGFYQEDRDVSSVVTDGSSTGGFLIFASGQHLTFSYYEDDSAGSSITYLGDAVGCLVASNKVVGSYDVLDKFLHPSPPAKPFYDSSYVEYLSVGQIVSAVPYHAPVAGLDEHKRVGDKWFQNASRDPLDNTIVLAYPNHQHVIGASQELDTNTRGSTSVDNGSNHSWIFIGRIESIENNQTKQANFKAETLIHELAHQWYVNHDDPANDRPAGHCSKNMYNNSALLCTMHEPASQSESQSKDGILGFHYFVNSGGAVNSEYIRIRTREEPIPQDYTP